jgi:hypothetical protein
MYTNIFVMPKLSPKTKTKIVRRMGLRMRSAHFHFPTLGVKSNSIFGLGVLDIV